MDYKLSFLADICLDNFEEKDIIDNCFLRKAKGHEIDEIENIVKVICEGFNRANPYYNAEKNEYNYWIIENPNYFVVSAFALSKIDATFFAHSLLIDETAIKTEYNQIQIATYFHDNGINCFNFDTTIHDEILKITTSLKKLHEIKNYESKYNFILKAIYDFSELKKISRYSPFKILGVFSIIELLLTHRRIGDGSKGKQLKTKVIEVNNRIEASINHLDYFTDTSISLEQIITKLYNYRSRIAHGDIVTNDFKLKNNDSSFLYKFLYELTRKILIQAIIEPQIIAKIKVK